jgi:hypothetical protein
MDENSGAGQVNDHPVVTEKIVLNMYAAGTGVSFNEASNDLVVTSRSYDDSPMCCPQHLDLVSFRWNGNVFEKAMMRVDDVPQTAQ